MPPRTVPTYSDKVFRMMNVSLKLGRNPDSITTATVPTSALGDAMMIVGNWWPTAASYAYHRTGVHYVFQRETYATMNSKQPVTRVLCSGLDVASKDTVLNFPTFNGDPREAQETIPILELVSRSLWEDALAKNSSQSNISWVNLPPKSWKNSTMGALVTLPAAFQDAMLFTTCNIDSRFAESLVWRFSERTVYGSPGDLDYFTLGRTKLDWEWSAVQTSMDWARSLNFVIEGTNQTAFGAYAETAGVNSTVDETHIPVIEAILAMMFTDGLSRIGSTASLQGERKGTDNASDSQYGPWVDEYMRFGNAYDVDIPNGADWLTSRLEVKVNGYAYGTEGWLVILAIAILLLHVALAIAHTLYSVISGISSAAWDTETEMVALAANSIPPPALVNTCGGIQCVSTLKTAVRVVTRATKGSEMVALEFGDSEELYGDDILRRRKSGKYNIKVNAKYGRDGDDVVDQAGKLAV